MTATIDEETQVSSARDKYATIVKRRADVRDQIEALQHAITQGDQQVVESRAQEIISGRPGAERSETALAQLMTQHAQLQALETELRALDRAKEQQAEVVERLERAAEREAASRLYEEITRIVRKQDGKLREVRALNDELLSLEMQLRKGGLAEVGGKTLLLLSRSGIAWNALSPTPIHGTPIHIDTWRENMKTILED